MYFLAHYTTLQLATLQRLVQEAGDRISWLHIGKTLNIVPNICLSKWEQISSRGLKGGPFSPEEDAQIRNYVAEWGDPKKTPGLWVKLQKIMKRRGMFIRQRWFNTLFHRKDDKVKQD